VRSWGSGGAFEGLASRVPALPAVFDGWRQYLFAERGVPSQLRRPRVQSKRLDLEVQMSLTKGNFIGTSCSWSADAQRLEGGLFKCGGVLRVAGGARPTFLHCITRRSPSLLRHN
jgi:hypothetical protein